MSNLICIRDNFWGLSELSFAPEEVADTHEFGPSDTFHTKQGILLFSKSMMG